MNSAPFSQAGANSVRSISISLPHAGWLARPRALKLRHTFTLQLLALPDDKQGVDIEGVSAPDDDTLVLSDYKNGRVSELRVSTGVIRVLFVEGQREGWMVWNALFVNDASGVQVMLVAEGREAGDGVGGRERECRVQVTRKEPTGMFALHTTLTLPERTPTPYVV